MDPEMHPAGNSGQEGRAIRCFVAVDLAPEVRGAIETVVRTFQELGADVRWVRGENLHVTLKFLGDVRETRLAGVRTALASVAGGARPFEVKAAGLGAFPSPRRARVLWVGILGAELAAVAQGIDEALAGEGFAREARPVTPHVTIGRVRSPRGWERMLQAMQPHWDRTFGVSQVDELVLYRSDLRREGPLYTPLERVGLGRCGRSGADQ